MGSQVFSKSEDQVVCFAHSAYQFSPACHRRKANLNYFSVTSFQELEANIDKIEVLVISGLWKNHLLENAKKLRFVQSISAGTDQYDKQLFKKFGVQLASGKGANANAVGQHAIALILNLARQLHLCRDNQHNRLWRGMISNPELREDELTDKTVLIIGLGNIGRKIARYARMFEASVIATRKHKINDYEEDIRVFSMDALWEVIPLADIVVLSCPLNSETNLLIGKKEFSLMKTTAYLINVSRGRVVDEEALVCALKEGMIAGAGLDVTCEEPLSRESPLWSMENVILTPHVGGETRRYEENILDILLENLARLDKKQTPLLNQVV